MTPKRPRSSILNLAYKYTQSVANISFPWRPGLIGYLYGALGIVNYGLQLFFFACGLEGISFDGGPYSASLVLEEL